MRFLTEADILEQVRGLASRSDKLMAAVAYWGKDAAERTGLAEHPNPAEVRVICDLLSGATAIPMRFRGTQSYRRPGQDTRSPARQGLDQRSSTSSWAPPTPRTTVFPGMTTKPPAPPSKPQSCRMTPVWPARLSAWFEKLWCMSNDIEPHLEPCKTTLESPTAVGVDAASTTPLTEMIRRCRCSAAASPVYACLLIGVC